MKTLGMMKTLRPGPMGGAGSLASLLGARQGVSPMVGSGLAALLGPMGRMGGSSLGPMGTPGPMGMTPQLGPMGRMPQMNGLLGVSRLTRPASPPPMFAQPTGPASRPPMGGATMRGLPASPAPMGQPLGYAALMQKKLNSGGRY